VKNYETIKSVEKWNFLICRWQVIRIDCSFGGEFQVYPGSPDLYHAPFTVKIINDNLGVCQKGPNTESDLEWIDLVGIDRVATSNKKKLVLAKMNYQQRLEKNVDEKNVADDENVDGKSANEIDELEHFIKNYSVVQYSIRNWVISRVVGQRAKLFATLYD